MTLHLEDRDNLGHWNANSNQIVQDLLINPKPCGQTDVNSTYRQYGTGTYWNGTFTYLYHALLWNNNLQTQVDLHPTFAGPGESSYATGVFGSQQVGYESNSFGTALHALLWHGTAASVIDLNPVGAINSEALGIGDGVQVGWQYLGVGNTAGEHATLWHGSAASAVDLNPSKIQIIFSEAWGVSGDQHADPGNLGAGIYMNPGGSGFDGGAQILNNIVQNNIIGIEFNNDGEIPALVQHNLVRQNNANASGASNGTGIDVSFGLVNGTINENTFTGQTNAAILNQTGPGGSSDITISKNGIVDDSSIALFNTDGVEIRLLRSLDFFSGESVFQGFVQLFDEARFHFW